MGAEEGVEVRVFDEGETTKMIQSWAYIELNYTCTGKCNYKVIPCGKCFVILLVGEDQFETFVNDV